MMQYLKKQITYEMATYQLEFLAARTCVKKNIDLQKAFCYLGVPVYETSYVFGVNAVDNLVQHFGALFRRAAVGIITPVERWAQELRKQITVCAMKLNAVKSSVLCANSGGNTVLDKTLNLFHSHGLGSRRFVIRRTHWCVVAVATHSPHTPVMSGNNVSHAKNRTRRKFLPNLQRTSMGSEILGRNVSLRVSTSAIRTIEKHGGLDSFLLQARNAELADDARSLKREILAVQSA